MEIEILSLFPEYFSGPFDASILRRAQDSGVLKIRHVQIRDFAEDKHQKVDDRPYGGGSGMVMKPEPISRAIKSVRRKDSHVIFLSPQGKLLKAEVCQRIAKKSHLILLCGHYEGIDERILKREVDEEISIGDYVLTNGALASIVLIDAMARFVPGVLGDPESAENDSFQEGILDCHHYTRPEVFDGERVPEILLEGNHADIAIWRKKEALLKTREVRPDLYLNYLGSREQEMPGEDKNCQLEAVLCVNNLKKSIMFYRKILGLTLIGVDEERAHFSIGKGVLTLVTNQIEKPSSMLLRLVVDSQNYFEKAAFRLKREGKLFENYIETSGKREFQIAFSDLDGHKWILFYPKGE